MPSHALSRLASGLLLTLSSLLVAVPARGHGSYPEVKQILLPADRPQQIILATNFGLIFSEDSGHTWRLNCEHGLSAYAAPYLLGAPTSQRIFAMTSGGIIYSDDSACGWHAAGGTLSSAVPYAFTVDPSSSKRAYAVGVPLGHPYDGDNIYVSDDGGLSFGQSVYTSPQGSALLSVLVAPSKPSVLFASMFSTPENHPVLLRSDDSGEHWKVASDLADSLGHDPFELLAIDPRDENALYGRILGGSAETLATSHDGGLSFVRSVSIPGKLSAFLKLASGTILVGGTAGTAAAGYRSKDGGQTFETWPGAPHVHALAERGGKLYVAGDNFGDGYVIAESDDEGAHLQPLAGFEQVQALDGCVADLCATSCAYYAGVGLWSAATCGVVSTPPNVDPVSGAGETGAGGVAETAAGGAAETAAGGAAGTAANAAGSCEEAEPIAPDPGSPGIPSTHERRLRASGGGCGCRLGGGRRTPHSTGLLLAVSMWVVRRSRGASARGQSRCRPSQP